MFAINLDLAGLGDLLGLPDIAQEEMNKAGRELVAATRAHAIERANEKLHTRRQAYIDGLKVAQDGADTWIVSLDARVRWIEDGMEEHSMVDDLLKSPKAKVSKDGVKYLSIPFNLKGGPTETTPAQQNLIQTVKSELRKVGAPYGGLEEGKDGQPKLGLVRSMDIMTKPVKTRSGPGTGKGPVGDVMQGPTGIPLLQGVKVYQNMAKGADGQSSVKKSIMTFRTVTSDHKDEGRWVHPGLEAVKIIDESADWALRHWEEQIAPKLVTSLMVQLSRGG